MDNFTTVRYTGPSAICSSKMYYKAEALLVNHYQNGNILLYIGVNSKGFPLDRAYVTPNDLIASINGKQIEY